MDKNVELEYREKTYKLKLGQDEIYAEGYTKTGIRDTETSTYTFEVEKNEYRVDKNGILTIHDDKRWVSVENVRSLILLRNAIEVALERQENMATDDLLK